MESAPTLILYLEDVTTTEAVDLGSCVLSNHPYNIYVDWCDGSEVEYYSGTVKPDITHLYSKADKQRIKIYGELGWYGKNETSGLLRNYLVGIEIKNSSPLTRVSNNAFRYYQKLRTIDGKMFENCVNQTEFNATFGHCTSLTSIPAELFEKNVKVKSFIYTFGGCIRLKISPGLFDKNTIVTSFNSTFYYCTSITSIPAGLFAKNTAVTSFSSAFNSCFSLANIPAELFAKNTAVTSFNSTFSSCFSLANIPAELFAKNTAVTSFMYTYSNSPKLQNICYNVACNPNTSNPFSGLSVLKEIALWNVIPSVKDLDAYISEFPTVTGGTLYLGVSEGFESTARTTLTEPQEEALTAKGWSFGGVLNTQL